MTSTGDGRDPGDITGRRKHICKIDSVEIALARCVLVSPLMQFQLETMYCGLTVGVSVAIFRCSA